VAAVVEYCSWYWGHRDWKQ